MDLKPSWEKDGWYPPELVLLKDITRRFSGALPQSGLQPPQMYDVRRSPKYLAPRGPFKKERLRAFVPELNCPLGHVRYCFNGCLEFSKEVTQLYQTRVILEAMPPGDSEKHGSVRLLYYHKRDSSMKNNGLKREENVLNLHKLIQDSWIAAGGASPAPTLDPIAVKGGTGFMSHPLVRIQFSESIMTKEDLNWGNRGKLACRQSVAERMIAGASLWIDDEHPILSSFERLSERPVSHTNDVSDILRNHLQKRRWVWITRMHHGKTVIDIPRTEEFYDARLAFFEHGSDCLLRSFCQRRQWTQKQIDKLATTRSIRGKLEQLIIISQIAGKKMKADSAAAATFGPWLDFLVNSTCRENDRIFRAVRELEVARYFILGLRYIGEINVESGDNTELLGVPEFSELNGTCDLQCAVESLLVLSANPCNKNGKTNQNSRQKEKICDLLAFLGRTRPGLTEWQQTRSKLQNLKGFCPQNEAECALLLVTQRQERCVLEEKEDREWNRLSEGSEGIVRPYTSIYGVGYPPRCQCSMDNCEYRNGFLEREKPRRYEDKELYCSKRNHTGGLEDSWPLSSGERINEEPISNQETEKHEEPERAHNFEESQKSERNNPKLKRSFGCKLGRLLLSFQPSTKLGSPSQPDASATGGVTAALDTNVPHESRKELPTARFNSAPTQEATARVTFASVEGVSQPATIRVNQNALEPISANSLQSQGSVSPETQIPLQATSQSSSSIKLVEWNPPRTIDVASAPNIPPRVPQQSPSRQSRALPHVQTTIIKAVEAQHGHRESTASGWTQDSGYQSKDSTESARSEEPLTAGKPLSGNLGSSKIASEHMPLSMDDEDKGQSAR